MNEFHNGIMKLKDPGEKRGKSRFQRKVETIEHVGSDSFSEPGWLVKVGGYRSTKGDLYNLENSIAEYLNLGAEITVTDESEIRIELDQQHNKIIITDKLKEFCGEKINLNMITEEEDTFWDEPYWQFYKDMNIEFKGKEIQSNFISASWIGSVGQTIYLVDGTREESDHFEKISYGADLLLDENNRIIDIQIFSEIGDSYHDVLLHDVIFRKHDFKVCDNLPMTLEKEFIKKLRKLIK